LYEKLRYLKPIRSSYLRLSPLFYFPDLYFQSITVELVMLKRFFITGTDTSVGKTVVSRITTSVGVRVKALRVTNLWPKAAKRRLKVCATKMRWCCKASPLSNCLEAVNPIAFSEDESSVAHSGPVNYTLLSNGLASLSEKVDHVVVEGTGGWRSLMNDLRPLSEWVVQEQLVVMVVGIQEGCIIMPSSPHRRLPATDCR
jgi:dethiobiotin synthetase